MNTISSSLSRDFDGCFFDSRHVRSSFNSPDGGMNDESAKISLTQLHGSSVTAFACLLTFLAASSILLSVFYGF